MESSQAQQTTNGDSVTEQLRTIEAFRDNFVTSMKEAAKQSKVELLTGDVAVAVRGDYVIANALIAPPPGVPIYEADRMFFVYLSLPANHVKKGMLPSGFYTIERMAEQKNLRVKVVNLEGETRLELPLNMRKIEISPQEGGTSPEEQLVAQATIEQTHETLYRDTRMQAHGIWCFPGSGVWYWTWM